MVSLPLSKDWRDFFSGGSPTTGAEGVVDADFGWTPAKRQFFCYISNCLMSFNNAESFYLSDLS